MRCITPESKFCLQFPRLKKEYFYLRQVSKPIGISMEGTNFCWSLPQHLWQLSLPFPFSLSAQIILNAGSYFSKSADLSPDPARTRLVQDQAHKLKLQLLLVVPLQFCRNPDIVFDSRVSCSNEFHSGKKHFLSFS